MLRLWVSYLLRSSMTDTLEGMNQSESINSPLQGSSCQQNELSWQTDIQIAAAAILDQIIEVNDGKVPYECAANVVLECYRWLNIPQGTTIETGKFTGWTKTSGLCRYPNHVWMRMNAYTIVDPLAERFRENHVPVEPISYEIEQVVDLKDLPHLDAFCEDFETLPSSGV